MSHSSNIRKLVFILIAWALGAVILGFVLLALAITLPGDSGNVLGDLFRTLFGLLHFPLLLSQNFLGWPTGGVGFVLGFALDGLLWYGMVQLLRRLWTGWRRRRAIRV